MSKEISVGIVFGCINGHFVLPQQNYTKQLDQTVPGGGYPGVVTVATGGTTLTLTEIATEGWAWLQNIDPFNFVTYGGATDQPFKMKPGEPALVRINPGETIKLVADTAACEVQILILED